MAFRSCGRPPALREVPDAPVRLGLWAREHATWADAAGARATAAGADSPQQGVDYSGTNVQEAGVDEPDIVKTNGSTMFTVENGQLESVDVSSTKPKLLDTVTLNRGFNHAAPALRDAPARRLRRRQLRRAAPRGPAIMIAPLPSSTTLTELDVSNPASLKVIKTLTIDGQYVDARMVGSVVRLVSSTSIPVNPSVRHRDRHGRRAVAEATAKNKQIIARRRRSSWLPSYRLGKRAARPLVQCRNVSHPVRFSGLGMLAVTTIDLSKGLAPLDSTAVMTDGRIVYASPTRLYVATEPWAVRPLPARANVAPPSATTTIDAFSIADPTKTTYVGSGTVSGFLLSQWSLSELDGVLRVVSTDAPAWWTTGLAEPVVPDDAEGHRRRGGPARPSGRARAGRPCVRRPDDRRHRVRRHVQAGRPALHDRARRSRASQTARQARAARLLVVPAPDFSDAAAWDRAERRREDERADRDTGVAVRRLEPRAPDASGRGVAGQGWSQAESDHHAFLYWPQAGLVVVPFGQQAVAMHVTRSGIHELGRIVHSQANQSELPQIDRSVVVGGSLLTISNAGVESDNLTTLAPLGWARFPAPAPTPVPMG